MLKTDSNETTDSEQDVPECLTRDNLTSEYFPNTSRGAFAAVVALCAIFFITSVNRLNHTDLWGHLCFGRWIVENHQLPQTDPFTSAEPPAEVLPYCWLGQVVGYEVFRWGGNDGLLLGHALLETLAAGLIMLAVARRGIGGYWPAVAGIAFAVLSLPILGTIRPQLFSQVGMACVLLAASDLPRSRHPLFWLPVVFALWANLHATMILGLGVLGVLWLGEIWEAWQQTQSAGELFRRPSVQHFGFALLLCLIAASLNPHGPWMFWEALTFGNSGTTDMVSEWKSLNVMSLTGGLLITSAVAAFLIFRNETKPRWQELFLLLLVGLATFSAIRMLVWWALLWPWIVIPVVARQFAKSPDSTEENTTGTDEDATSMRTVLAMAFVFITLVISPPTHSLLHSETRGPAQTMSKETPNHVAEEIRRRGLEGSFIAPTDWADYVVWASHGKMKPLVYGHFHLATPENLADYRQVMSARDWLKIVRKHHVKYVLVSRLRMHDDKLSLARAIIREPQVRIVYQDRQAVLAEVLPRPPSKSDGQPAAATNTPATEEENRPLE